MPWGDAAAAAANPRRATALGTASADAAPQVRTCLLLLAAVAALWMATRPYGGVVHDARLYALQALGAADPARFADDLFLRFGSQDRFTVFSRVYEPVLRWAGVSLGALLLTMLGHAAWLGGAYRLAMALFGDRVRALAALAGLVALPSTYGAGAIFSFGEPFLTPRLFAEALAMLALGCAVRGSFVRAAAALAAAGLLHPIMAAPGAAAVFLFAAPGKRAWWIAAACAGAAAVGLAALGVEPFARLGVRFDQAWFEVVRERAADMFVGGWSLLGCCALASPAALAVLGRSSRVTGPQGRRLLGIVLLAAVLGLALTALGADLARNQFLTNIQPWRAAWLLGVLGHLMAVPLLLGLATGGAAATRGPAAVALCAGIAVLAVARVLPPAHLWSAILLVLAAALSLRRGEAAPVHRALVAFAVAGASAAVAYFGFVAKGVLEALPDVFWSQVSSLGLCAAGLGVAAAALRPRTGRGPGVPGPILATAAAVALLFCAALGWDQRTAWTKYVESPEPPPADLAAFVPDGAAVYWYGGVDLLWLKLKRSSYHSCSQGAGVIFFRGTALAFRHRVESFRFEPKSSELCPDLAERWEAATPDDLRRACRREPELDLIVLPFPVGDLPRREWASPVKLQAVLLTKTEVDSRAFDRFHAYGCDDLRR